ncbi:HNH endonuclease [Streptomyces sp. NPDC051014]|uniref:HNH endonuclease n=1 Tax=Streptomyces sp. NPDC051014 TaxID=3155751 RepID=UPI0033CD9D71
MRWFVATSRTLHRHHVVYRSHGGPDHRSNLILIHAECHRQHHAGDVRRGLLKSTCDRPLRSA